MSLPVLFKFLQDVGCNNGNFLPYTPFNYTVSIPATTDTTWTVPGPWTGQTTGQKEMAAVLIQVSDSADIWCAFNATAAVPAGATFAASTSQLINANSPKLYPVKYGDVLHFYTAASNKVICISMYTM